MNDEQLGVALRDALAAPELTADRYAGQRLRHRVRARQDARRGALTSVSFAVVAVLLIGGFVGLFRPSGGGDDSADGGGSGDAGGVTALENDSGGGPQTSATARTTAGRYGGRLRTPVQVVEAVRVEAACPDLTKVRALPRSSPASGCVVIGEPVVTIRTVTAMRLVPPGAGQSRPVLQLDLVPADAAAFFAYTSSHVSGTIAFVIAGTAVSVPEIQGPIRGPSIDLPVDGHRGGGGTNPQHGGQ